MIRRLSLAAIALLIAAPVAHAGVDCYAGVAAGKNATIVTEDGATGAVDVSLNGFQLGARAGCDAGVPLSPLIIGAFAGYDLPDVESDIDTGYASIGVRAGFKLNDSATAYGLLGIAAPDLKFTDASERGTLYGAGLELDFSNVSPGLVGFVEFSRIDWRDTGADATTDTIMVGAKIRLNVLK